MMVAGERLTSWAMVSRSKEILQTSAKAVNLMGLIGGFFAEALLIKSRQEDPVARQKHWLENASKYSRRALKTLNIDVETKGFDSARMNAKAHLLVGNHMSYIDAMVAASVLPCAFVTSVDMGEQVFLGEMAELGGSIFIERRNRDRVDQDLSTMANALRNGLNVMIYPEGTSTNGDGVLPFKKSLLMSAVEAGVDIQPVVIRYKEVDGEKFGPQNRDSVCWYGKMDFASHLLRVLALRQGIRAELVFLEPIQVRSDSTRNELAEKSHSAVSSEYLATTA